MKGEAIMFWIRTLVRWMDDDSRPGPGGTGAEEGNGNGGSGGS